MYSYHHSVIKQHTSSIFCYFFLIAFSLFSPFFLHAQVPFPGDYLLAWHEPWHSVYSREGVPTIAHKPVVDDAFRHLYPLRVLAWDAIGEGRLPLWNPYNAAGTPLLAIMHQGYLNPFGIVFLFFSPPIAWSLYLIFQIPLLGLTTYWYCRTIQLSRLASLFSSTVLIFSGFVIARIEYAEFLYILAMLPLFLAIIEKIREKKSPLWFFAIPPVVAFLFFAGQPHMMVYVLGAVALYSLIRFWGRWGATLILWGAELIGIGLAAVQLVPSFELLQHSTISQESSRFIFQNFLLPFKHLVTIIIPNFFGSQATYNFFGPGSDYVETIASVGAIPVFFSLLAFAKKRGHIARFFLLLLVVAIVATLDWFGTRFFYSLPIPVLSADVPSRIFVLSTFALAILAGIGFDAWQKKPALLSKSIVVGFIACVVFIAFTVSVPCPEQIRECRLVSLRNSLLEVGVAASVLLAMRRKYLMVLPIIAVFLLGIYNAKKFLPFAPAAELYPKLAVLEKLQELTSSDRVFSVGAAHIRTNILAQFRVGTPEYFDPLHIKRFAELVSFANTGLVGAPLLRSDIEIIRDAIPTTAGDARRERLLDLTNTRYLLYKNTELEPRQRVVWQDATWSIVEHTTALPRAYVVNSFETETDDEKLLTKLFQPSFNPTRQVFLEEAPSVASKTSGLGSVTIDGEGPEEVLLSTETNGDSLLVLTDTYYPGWKATVDGVETKIYRANYTFRAVVVPKGKRTIQFIYQPQSLAAGLRISLLSAVLYIILIGTYVLRVRIKK